jgi:hypothetical protein
MTVGCFFCVEEMKYFIYLSLIILLTGLVPSSHIHCAATESAEDSAGRCPKCIEIENIAKSAVLVDWSGCIENGRGGSLYGISYVEADSSIEGLTFNTTKNSTILVDLRSDVTYEITVTRYRRYLSCSIDHSIKYDSDTLDVSLRAHVYYPLLHNESVISAIVVWRLNEALTFEANSYKVKVYSADAYRSPINGSPFYGENNYVRLEYNDNSTNELVYPLPLHNQFIIQVSCF